MRLSAHIVQRPPTAAKIVKQLNYGTAVGLTKLAKEGQAAVQGALKGTFTLRGNWWQQSNKYGIRITPAKPASLRSEVKTAADWLAQHEKGGEKTPRGGAHVAVPTGQVRRNKRAIIPRGQRPRGLGGKAFVMQTKAGPVLAQRFQRGPRKGLVVLYGLEPKVRIRKQSTFYEPIEKVIRRRGKAIIAREQMAALRAMR